MFRKQERIVVGENNFSFLFKCGRKFSEKMGASERLSAYTAN